ncbi:hypothetical protein [Formosa sp. PL04]|uniref:hypothetical protein n=1 Tax=Formosa sp. PL04 TaxID=3081755 RepID=UPI002981284B|nr:hypothetical protein [Formosa sp. PL04]MDW5287409.1 hypothetical protein [Formosa sp. PL04]
MKHLFFILICITLALQSCDDNCGDCFTPPTSFIFELLDETSGENVFTNGTYNPENITITNTLDEDSKVEFTFIEEDNLNLINIYSVGWKTEIVNLEIKIENQIIFNLYVAAERKSENCCSFTTFNEITIENANHTLDNKSGVYTILVP